MLKIKRGMCVPPDALTAEAFVDYPRALQWIHEVSLRQDVVFLDRVQAIAAEFPKLAGTEVEYWEASMRDLAVSGLSPRDQAELRVCFVENPAGVLVYSEPKLIVSVDSIEAAGVDNVLRHELVHLEQRARGDTELVPEGQIWQGVLYGKDEVMDLNAAMAKKVPGARYRYLSLPWEREAYIRAAGPDRYEEMLRRAFLTMEFFNHQDCRSAEQAADLACALCDLRFNLETALKLDDVKQTTSGSLIASVMSDGTLVEAPAIGEAIWASSGVILRDQPPSEELTTPEDAWRFLIQLASAFFETYLAEPADAPASA